MKKVAAAILSSVLLATSVAGVAGASPSVEYSGVTDGSNQNLYSEDYFSDSTLLTPYLKVNEENQYYLAEGAKDVVSEENYNLFLTGLNRLNALISDGTIEVANGTIQQGPNSPSTTTPPVSTYVFSNPYWWGYAITFNNAETINQANILEDYGDTVALLAAVLAVIPATSAEGAAAALVGVSATAIAKSFRSHNKGKGVTLNLHWLPAPYYEVTTNNG